MAENKTENARNAKSAPVDQIEKTINQSKTIQCSTRKTIREDKLQSDLLRRLKRVEGQVRGIGGMVERDVYCDDILHQIAAARSALKSISHLVMEDHIHGCLVDRIRDGDDNVVDELLVTIGKLL